MLAFYVQEKYSNTNFKIKLFLGFLALQIFLRIYLFYKGSNLIYQDNKYPPNLYYLSYGISWFLFLDLLFNRFKFFSNEYFYKIINFFSTNSFTLFFLQYLVIQSTFRFIKNMEFTPVSLFFWVTFWCVFLQLGINFLNKKNNSKISKY